ncbi:MAG TPA: hypothetical protein ENJ09_16095 [Planctomycetes bacterium]|nr:hypothetical protein [Planctomycetota bacterium]
MKSFRRILVGIDLTLDGNDVSAGARRAALQAQWLAQGTGASLTFLHSTWADAYPDPSGEVLRHGPGPEATAALEALASEYDTEEVPCELVYSDERPWLEITNRVLRGENDLVVVARHNAPGAHLFGSVTRKLLRKCPAPVWVVNEHSPLVHEAIVAATDLTPVGERALEMAAFLARVYGCKLHAVHAWQRPLGFEILTERRGDEQMEEALHHLEETVEERLAASIARVAPDLDVKAHVACDAPARMIERVLDEVKPDLLVMGTVSRTGVKGLLMGNTAERLLPRVECSLLAIKPEGFVSPVSA